MYSSKKPTWSKQVFIVANKRRRIPKGQSRIDNPLKLSTLGTQDTGRRQTKQKT